MPPKKKFCLDKKRAPATARRRGPFRRNLTSSAQLLVALSSVHEMSTAADYDTDGASHASRVNNSSKLTVASTSVQTAASEISAEKRKKREKLRLANKRQDSPYRQKEIERKKGNVTYLEQPGVFPTWLRANKYCTQKNKLQAVSKAALRAKDDYRAVSRATLRGSKYHGQAESACMDAESEWDAVVAVYEGKIKLGPSEICISCGGLWFARSISNMKKEQMSDKGIGQEIINKVFFVTPDVESGKFCRTCRRDAWSGKVPKLCLANGLDFPEIPDCLRDLTCLEERLVAPRIPFMQIRSLGYEGQCSLKGNVVNVPVSVDTSVSVLPRTFDQTFTIQIQLKRKLAFKHHYQCETIRPVYIYNAARYLVSQPLYQQEGVTLSVDWLTDRPEVEEFVIDKLDLLPADVDAVQQELVDDPDENLDEPEVNPGEEETLVNAECNLSLAPGEGQRPLPLFLDIHSEELSFPSIYCGLPRLLTVNLTYNQIAKSEARRYDRRGARVDKLLYAYKKQEILKLSTAVGTCLRKRRGTLNVTAAQVLNENFLSTLIQHDDGFRILNTVRSSPAYWEKEKKKVMAMIRQFGVATLFFTLSAAETRWPELLVILYKVVDGREVTKEEALASEFREKCRLIRKDPITCARYFDHRVRCLLQTWKTNSGPFGKYPIEDFYYRVEFQHRGSPHIHGMLWLKNAPKFSAANAGECETFIDEMVTCNSQIDGLVDLVPLQTHHHTRTCQKINGPNKRCRFGLPLPPMPYTKIIVPIENITKEIRSSLLKRYNIDITQKLATMHNAGELKDLSFEAFLERLNMTETQYMFLLKSSIVQPKVFLNRAPSDVIVNAFNPKILGLHRANMDIQFIIDTYACCAYIINYINKSCKGISRLLNTALQEVRNGNVSVKKRLQIVANTFVNGSEISAQEAAYNVMSMPVSNSSRAEVYINTAPAGERVRMMKPAKNLAALDPASTDIFNEGPINHYANRADEMEDMCLAYVLGNYEFTTGDRIAVVTDDNNDDLLSSAEEDDPAQDKPGPVKPGNLHRLKHGRGYWRKRTKCKIIRYRRYCLESEPKHYYREQLMLFLPWRTEQSELIDVNAEAKWNVHKEIVTNNRSQFNSFEDDDILNNAMDHAEILEEGTERLQGNDENENTIDDEFRSYAMEIPEGAADVMMQAGMAPPADLVQTFLSPDLLPEDDYMELTRQLNTKQRAYLMHIVNHFKTNTDAFYHFVSGGAGVGKSKLIQAIYQVLLRYFNSQAGQDPFQMKVLLCAPTGKAAYNIGGMTLHSAFRLPISQAGDCMTNLGPSVLNTVYSKLSELKLIIIDEVSMVGTRMFHQIETRLRQIFRTEKLFGGIPIVTFGDMRQLAPVGDGWIFTSNRINPCSELVGPYLWRLFSFYELTEIMRQRDDVPFANVLNHMACGTMTAEDVSLIAERNFTNKVDQIPKGAIHLFRSNAEVEQYNNVCISKFNTESAIANAFDKALGEGSVKAKENMMKTVSNLKTSETSGLPLKLVLKLKVRYMVTMNIDTGDGLVNGAIGILERIDYGQNSAGTRIPVRAWVDFHDPAVGREARAQFVDVIKQNQLGTTWTPIITQDRVVKRRQSSNLQIHRRQFPLVVAEGMTVHKSQGSTYQQVAVNVTSTMPRSSLYVACSRSTSANGLFVVGTFKSPKPPSATDLAQAEVLRLESHRLTLKFDEFTVKSDAKYTAVYHNIQSLNKHFDDIVCDPVYNSVDMLFFVETWTLENDEYLVTDYRAIGRIDCKQKRTAYGVVCFVKSRLHRLVSNVKRFEGGDSNSHIEILTFDFENITFCVVYNSPSMTSQTTEIALQHALECHLDDVVLVGDMNVDSTTIKNSRQQRLLNELGLTSQLTTNVVTTNGNTQIDWCFSNRKLSVKPYESIFSYHKPLHLSWHKDKLLDHDVEAICELEEPTLPTASTTNAKTCMYPAVSRKEVLELESDESDVISLSSDDTDDSAIKIVCGSHHQGDDRYSEQSRGRQCTANAAVSIAMAHLIEPEKWVAQTLDLILLEGDRLYRASLPNLPAGVNYLQVEDLLLTIQVNQKTVWIAVNDDNFTAGAITPVQHTGAGDNSDTIMDLPTGLEKFFNTASTGILMAHGISVAVGKCARGYWLCDSHSRDQDGFLSENGKSCLALFTDLTDLSAMFLANVSHENTQYVINNVYVVEFI